MYYFLSLIAGIITAVMITVNGGLNSFFGLFTANILIHAAGGIAIFLVILIKRERFIFPKQPFYFYLGGFVGVFIILFNNIAFGQISVSAMLALGLLGQVVFGFFIDEWGWFGMPIRKFRRDKILGLVLIGAGIAFMIDSFAALAVSLSFLVGVFVVLARTLNGGLGQRTSVYVSCAFNYIFGLLGSLAVFAFLGRNEILEFIPAINAMDFNNIWLLAGGPLGMTIVLMFNAVTPRISAFYVTLLSFIGQILAGILIDWLLVGQTSLYIIIGGVLTALGLGANMYADSKSS